MATYSFKSSGKTKEQQELELVKSSPIPFGIKTPLALGSTEGIFQMNYSLGEQFADNLRNLLQTNWGERLGLYQYGANLRPLTTEFVSQEDFDSKAIERISAAVGKWMPFIDLQSFTSTVDRNNNRNIGIVRVNVTYNIPALQENNREVQIVLYVI